MSVDDIISVLRDRVGFRTTIALYTICDDAMRELADKKIPIPTGLTTLRHYYLMKLSDGYDVYTKTEGKDIARQDD